MSTVQYMRQDSGPLPLHSLINFLSKLLNRSKISITHHKLSTKRGLVPAVHLELGSGESDFAAFVQNNGIPSADMTFCKGYPVYHAIPCMMTLYGWKIW
ncbi:hypothetical protein RchiOBHm_Chr5g0038921 [Rosa chinensis]|uniref:Uncharacterized protein n=1 Tax=Rosa chinensis TaxID=74649 RepID=A0A2P6QC53_ROSCH|nr:hypothetical protein RchiOBHm_Chr5g0038921 [Rosa chinensis]